MADENTIVLGTKVETSEALEGIQRFASSAGEKLRELADGGDGDARKLLLDTDEAEAALREVADEFQRTGRTSEEALGKAEAALRRVSGALGFEQDLQLVAPEFEEISKASRDAGEAMERFSKAAESGGKGAQRSATQAQVAIDRLETAIKQARATGGPVPAEWEKRLAALRVEMTRNIDASARFAAAQKDVQDELAASTERVVGLDEQATTLTEGIIKRFPKAQGAIVAFGASLATLEVSYRETRQFVEFVRDHFGVDIDKGIQEGIQGWAEYFDFVQNGQQRLQEAVDLEVNAARISDRLRREQGETFEHLTRRLDAYSAGLRQAKADEEESATAAREFAEAVAGVKVEDLEKRLESLFSVLGQFKGDFSALAQSRDFPRFAGEVRDISALLLKYKEALRSSLSGQELLDFDAAVTTFERSVRDKLVGTLAYAVEATKAILEVFGVKTPEAIRKSVSELRVLIEAYGGLGKATHEQADQVAAEADRILKAIALLPPSQREALADITASLHATSDAYREHAGKVDEFAASITERIKKETAARLAEYEKEKAALAGLTASAGSARDALLKSLEKPGEPGRAKPTGDERDELAQLKLKPFQSEEDIQRIGELEKQLGGLREKQEAARAGSEEVSGAISTFRQELAATGTTLSKLDQEGIAVLLARLQQTAEESGVTAVQISEAFAGVDTIVSNAKQRAAELNGTAAAAVEAARGAAAQAQALGAGAQDIVGVVQKSGETLVTDLQTAVDTGGKLIDRTVDQGKQATADVVAVVKDGQITITQAGSATAEFIAAYGEGAEVISDTIKGANESTGELAAGTEKAGAAVKNLVLGVDGLGAGMERVALESSKAGEGLQEVADVAGDAGEGLKLIGSHAADAAAPVSALAAGLDLAGKSAEPLHSSADAFQQMGRDVPAVVRELSQLEPAEATAKRAVAYTDLSVALTACAVAGERLTRALPTAKTIREEAAALLELAEALEKVTAGLEAERAAREGEEAPN